MHEAREVHSDWANVTGNTLSIDCFSGKSCAASAQSNKRLVLTVEYTPYDATAVDLIDQQSRKFEGTPLETLAFVVPSSLQISPTGLEAGLANVLARGIARSCDITLLEPGSSFANWEVIEQARLMGRRLGIDRSDIVGAVVGSVAHSLNTVCSVDINRGVEFFRHFAPEDADLLSLYECGTILMNVSRDYISSLEERITALATQVGYFNPEHDAYPSVLFDRDAVHDMLQADPEMRRDLLGLGVCLGAQGSRAVDYTSAARAAYEAWEGKISFSNIHDAILPMRDLRNRAARNDDHARQYLGRIDEVLQSAIAEKVREEMHTFLRANPRVRSLLVVSDVFTADFYKDAVTNFDS
jgi:hypothetical protein